MNLKAWCHWKKKEKGLSPDDAIFVHDISSLITKYELAENVIDKLKQFISNPDNSDELYEVLLASLKQYEKQK